MQRHTLPALLAALLATASLGAQAPAPDATVHPQDGSVTQSPEAHPDIPKLTQEEQQTQMKAQSARLAELQAQQLARQLGLSAVQLGKLRPIMEERTKQLRALVASGDQGSPQIRARAKQIQLAFQDQIKSILDPAQRQLFEKMLAAHEAQRTRRSTTAAAQRRRIITNAPPAAPKAAPAAPAAAPTAPDTAPPAPPTPPQSN